MLSLTQIEDQLKKVGCNFRFWGRPEIRELCNILLPDEVIAQCVNGFYEGGWAMLCVTNHRLLLIDKKVMFLTLEDIRFDMISEIDFSAHLLEGAAHISTPNRKMVFRTWSQGRLRKLLNYVQQRMMEIRQHQQFGYQPSRADDRQDQVALVGGLAMQGNTYGNAMGGLQFNPYNRMPLLMRRRRYPKFY